MTIVRDVTALAAMRARFREDGFVALGSLLTPPVRRRFDAEASALLARHAQRRDLRIAVTGGSARRYAIASRADIATDGVLVPAAYRSRALARVLGAIAGEPIVPVPHLPEEFIATRMEHPGDEHGWHWDDYRYALVWIVRAPAAGAGGEVELVPDTRWDKRDPRVAEQLRGRTPSRFAPASDSAYFLRADTTLHRVAPLLRDTVREVVTFSYTTPAEVTRAVTHETLDAILVG
jgi:hypothetical protein